MGMSEAWGISNNGIIVRSEKDGLYQMKFNEDINMLSNNYGPFDHTRKWDPKSKTTVMTNTISHQGHLVTEVLAIAISIMITNCVRFGPQWVAYLGT